VGLGGALLALVIPFPAVLLVSLPGGLIVGMALVLSGYWP